MSAAVTIRAGRPGPRTDVVLVWPRPSASMKRGTRRFRWGVESQFRVIGLLKHPAVRFGRVFPNTWWQTVRYALRHDPLGDTGQDPGRLHPRHMSGDQILLTVLSLMRCFYELLAETLYEASRQRQTLRDGAALIDQRVPCPRPAPPGWRLLRGYSQPVAMSTAVVWASDLPVTQKLLCQVDVARTAATWAWFPAPRLASRSSPWRTAA
jgi:hypothetical protein